MTVRETAYYTLQPRFHVGVDVIILALNHDRLSVLLVRRDFEPEKGKWSLIGGFVGEGESVETAAKRVLADLTGLRNVFIRQLGAFGDVDRDPGARVVSVAYFALLNMEDVDREAVASHHAAWVDVNNLPVLGFDHERMIEGAIATVRRKILNDGLAFNLLPPLFTLTQLQTLVETVLGEKLDKRNFRKRMTDSRAIEPTGIIDKTGSKRGAMLFKIKT